MATRDWSKVDWTNNEDNNLIRAFLADPDNIMNCNQCPYKISIRVGTHCLVDNTIAGLSCLAKGVSRGEICGSLFLSLKEILVCNV